jgi:hypothetical protein
MSIFGGMRLCVAALIAMVMLASPTFADSADCMAGSWKDVPDNGGTLTLTFTGTPGAPDSLLVGNGTGGKGHTTLTNHFIFKQPNAGLSNGTYTNEEGVVKGSGTATIRATGANNIEVTYDGNWSGGGGSGHVSGKSELVRVSGGRTCR